ncbi:MAG: ATP-binding cassette domain-containing protein [Pseudomonadota bacterium]
MEFDLDFRKTLHSGARSFELDVRLQTPHKRLVLIGPSGAGKSLTLKVLAGLLTPDSGHVRQGGVTLFDGAANLAPQQRRAGYVFQDYALFPHLNVRQNIGFGLAPGWRNPARAHCPPAVAQWLTAFGLEQVAHQLPHQLSGGQRQRTALARALAGQPRMLLLDEPFAALDPSLRAAMRAELDALQRRLDLPMMIITHDDEDARVFGDAVFTLVDGKVQS